MPLTFDGPNKLILLETGVNTVQVIDLYSRWKEWFSQGDNAKYLPAFRSVGGDPTVAGKYLGSTFFLANGWRIRPYEGNHRLIVTGNLYTEEGESPFLSTLGNYTVAIISEVSNLLDRVSVLVDKAMASPPEVVLIGGKAYVKIADPDIYG